MCSTIRATFRQSALAASASSRRRYVIMCSSSYTVSAASVAAVSSTSGLRGGFCIRHPARLQTGLRTRSGTSDDRRNVFKGLSYSVRTYHGAMHLTTRLLSHLEPTFGLQTFEDR